LYSDKTKSDLGLPKGEDAQVDLANALDLSESEEEEETEDLHEFFARQQDEMDQERQQSQKLYFFQFPTPFPTFEVEERPMDAPDLKGKAPEKRVTFTADTKPAGLNGVGDTKSGPEVLKEAEPVKAKPSGEIGQLEVYASGAVKIRLGNNTLLDVMAASPSSFLQQAVHVDLPAKRMSVLGEVNQRFMVSPNVEQLLEEIERARLEDVKEMEVDG